MRQAVANHEFELKDCAGAMAVLTHSDVMDWSVEAEVAILTESRRTTGCRWSTLSDQQFIKTPTFRVMNNPEL